MQDQRQEAHQCVCADAAWQAVVDRPDLDLAFQRPEPALDVSQAFVALHHLGRRRIGVGHQQQLAVQLLQVLLTGLVDGELEELALEVDLDQVRQVRLRRASR